MRTRWGEMGPDRRFGIGLVLGGVVAFTMWLIVYAQIFVAMTRDGLKWSLLVFSQCISENVMVYSNLFLLVGWELFQFDKSLLACAWPVLASIVYIYTDVAFGLVLATQLLLIGALIDRLQALISPAAYRFHHRLRRALGLNALAYIGGPGFMIAHASYYGLHTPSTASADLKDIICRRRTEIANNCRAPVFADISEHGSLLSRLGDRRSWWEKRDPEFNCLASKHSVVDRALVLFEMSTFLAAVTLVLSICLLVLFRQRSQNRVQAGLPSDTVAAERQAEETATIGILLLFWAVVNYFLTRFFEEKVRETDEPDRLNMTSLVAIGGQLVTSSSYVIAFLTDRRVRKEGRKHWIHAWLPWKSTPIILTWASLLNSFIVCVCVIIVLLL